MVSGVINFWTPDVSGTASYEITRPSVRPSLSFLKNGSLIFSIVHDIESSD